MFSRVSEVIYILERMFKISLNEFLAYRVAVETGDSFETLIATILTQNTSEGNAFRAYFNLKKCYPTLRHNSKNCLCNLLCHLGYTITIFTTQNLMFMIIAIYYFRLTNSFFGCIVINFT